MAIEIRELIIKATVVPEGTANGASATASGGNSNVSANEEMISSCVEKVLEVIKEKNGR